MGHGGRLLVDAAKLVHLRECFKGRTLPGLVWLGGRFLERWVALIALGHSLELKSGCFRLSVARLFHAA